MAIRGRVVVDCEKPKTPFTQSGKQWQYVVGLLWIASRGLRVVDCEMEWRMIIYKKEYKMKILAMADIHAHNYQNHAVIDENGMNSRLSTIINAMDEALDVAFEERCEAILIAGDIFHVRGSIKPAVYNAVFKQIGNMAAHIPVYLISGNHDMEARSGHSALEPFGAIDGCTLLDNVYVFVGDDKAPIKIAGIPYYKDIDEFKKQLDRYKDADIIMMHQGIDDFRPTASIPETTITVSYLRSITDAIIVSGHYHKVMKAQNVLSPGSIIQHHFGDEGDDKGCWVIDTDTKDMKFFNLTYPEFVTVDKSERDNDYSGHIVRVRITDNDNIEEIKNRIGDCIELQIEVVKSYQSVHEKTVTIGEPYDMLSEYIDCVEMYKPKKAMLMKQFAKVCL